MTNFNQFISTFDSDPSRKGKQFETFVKWYLKNDPEWSSQVETVWLWDEYPDRWGPDCGIDLVFTHKNGETWAVQAKCYSAEYQITKHDVDKFLSESNRKEIQKRLLIATTDRLGANARQVCEAQEKQVVRYLLSHFEDSNLEYPESLAGLSKAKPRQKPLPKPHQIEAIEAVEKGMASQDRGQLIMACGTGKTYTALWIKEKLKPQSTLVLVPSLNLLSQTLHEWMFASNDQFEALCVCSDESVSKKESDEIVTSTADLAFPVTSDHLEIAKFLKSEQPKVIFSTYQSSQLIAYAQLEKGVPSIDLVVADEAHRCTGKVNGNFSLVLSESKIRAKKRLFTTATPKTYSTQLKKSAEERGIEIFGMDDPTVFGTALYTLNFGEAIQRGLLTDYQVVIIGVDGETVSSLIQEREFVNFSPNSKDDAESLGIKIGLLKAIKDFNLRRVISFHSRVSRAKEFSKKLPEVLNWMEESKRPSGNIKTDFVSGEMPTDIRRVKLRQLKEIGLGNRALLTNARCLAEGVDVPSLDGICFVDPRSSPLDIIQAVGRAIRQSEDKKIGTIVLPVFIGEQDEISSKIESSKYSAIWNVLNALKSHDDRLSEELAAIRFKLGRSGGSGREVMSLSNLTIDLPQKIDQSFVDSFTTLIVENTTESWDEILGRLVKFKEREGHLRVPYYFDDDGYKLGQRVVNLRQQRNILSKDRIFILDEMGFVWNEIDEKWNDFITALTSFHQREGHLNVKTNHVENGYRLGDRVIKYRVELEKNNDFYKDRIDQLERMGFIWDSNVYNWNQHFEGLKSFKNREGHITVPRAHRENNLLIGKWIQRQRSNYKNLTKDQQMKLAEIGFVLDPFDSSWNQALTCLDSYIKAHGNSDVPQRYVDGSFKLGVWCHNQRKQFSENKLTPEKIESLNERSFNWNPLSSKWDKWVELLKKYKETHGNCDVPKRSLLDGERLGAWVLNTRTNKKNLSEERIAQLTEIGFSWNLMDEMRFSAWDEGIRALDSYINREGDSYVPKSHREDGFELYSWCTSQRKRFSDNKLSEGQVLQLNQRNFDWNPLATRWNRWIDLLKKYRELNGHIDIPKRTVFEGEKLGAWIGNLRSKKGKLSKERIDELDELGFIWSKG
jgi:superfamily II DNA or RNA helicase